MAQLREVDSPVFGVSLRPLVRPQAQEAADQEIVGQAHIMCGVKTNVVTALEIHGQDAGDCPQLPKLLDATTQQFDVQGVSGDLGYTSVANLQAITDAGARPYILFMGNATSSKAQELGQQLAAANEEVLTAKTRARRIFNSLTVEMALDV